MIKEKKTYSKTIATTWLRSCSGCHMKMFDLHEQLINFQDKFKINYINYRNSQKNFEMADIGIIEGSVSNQKNEETLKNFRKKVKILIALGTCACFGDSQNLRKIFLNESKNSQICGSNRGLQFAPKPINQIVPVDYYIPGCTPLFTTIKNVVITLLEEKKVQNPKPQNLCSRCKRVRNTATNLFFSKELMPSLDTFYSAIKVTPPNPDICFLEQGILCLGPFTIDNCSARCIRGNTPCWGCMGSLKKDGNDEWIINLPLPINSGISQYRQQYS